MYTLEDAVESIGFGKFQIKLLFILGFFNTAEALEMLLLSFLSSALKCEWQLPGYKIALITTVVFVGMMVFAPLWGKFGDIYGRRPIILISAFLTCYFGILTSFSPIYIWVLIFRTIVGAGIAGGAQAFILLLEFIPMRLRARVVLALQIFWPIGSVLETVLAAFVLPNLSWRWLVGISSVPLGITLILFKFAPESARYCIANGQQEKAEQILMNIAKENKKSLPEGSLIKIKKTSPGKVSHLFHRSIIRTTLQLWIIWFSCAFLYYGIVLISTEILKPGQDGSCKKITSDLESPCPICIQKDMYYYVQLIVSTCGELFAYVINGIFLDLIGRKYTLALTFCGSGVFYLLLIICTSKTVKTVFVFGIKACTQACFSTAYIYTGEVYPTVNRALGVGTCSAFARIGAIITPFIAESFKEYSLLGAMCIYGIISFLAALSAALLPIETKGRQLQDSQSETATQK